MPELQAYTHGDRLLRKATKSAGLGEIVSAYKKWRRNSLEIAGRSGSEIESLVKLLNDYKEFAEPILDSRDNSAQEGLQPSILEEFFGYLFIDLDKEAGVPLLRRPASSFIGLIFNPRDVKSLTLNPEFTIREKDHDFVLGSALQMSIGAEGVEPRAQRIVVPAVAIECKRYLERNMLDECAGTAERIKKATPYCKYIVAAEFLKLDDASPELSDIDEIYILRRQRNLDRGKVIPNPIYHDLIQEIYRDAVDHIKRIWWDPESGLKCGKVFNLPR